MALQVRSMGFQKLGLGIAIGTLASARIKLNGSDSLDRAEPKTELNTKPNKAQLYEDWPS